MHLVDAVHRLPICADFCDILAWYSRIFAQGPLASQRDQDGQEVSDAERPTMENERPEPMLKLALNADTVS